MSAPVLTINQLNKWYGSVHALNDLCASVEKGQVLGLLGPNGSGKTTALGIILGVLRASSGSFSWFGQGSRESLKTRVGALLEHPNFYPWMSARQNLRIVATIRKVTNIRHEIDRVLELVKLRDHADVSFQTFSLGMKQRLAIAATLLGGPECLVLDEPTNGIDAEGIAEIRRIILDLSQHGITIILASHILDEVQKVCSAVVMLKKGKVMGAGPIAEVLSQDSWVEVSASDPVALAKVLADYSQQSGLSIHGQVVRLKMTADADLSALNHFVAERGIYLSQLSRQTASLETQFLKLLES